MPTAPRPVSALGQLRAVVDSGHGPIMMAAGDRQGQHKLSTRSGNDGKQPGTTGKAPGRRSRAYPPRGAWTDAAYYPCQRLGAYRSRAKIFASLFWTGVVSVSIRWALGRPRSPG